MRVLLIEDDLNTLKSVELLLRTEGLAIDVAHLGEDGLRMGRLYDDYGIVLLDLVLPDMDGYEVLERLRAAGVRTPVLILSALAEAEEKIKGLAIGADDYLTKPFDKGELIARIHAVVRRSQDRTRSVNRTGALAVDLDSRTIEIDGQPVHMTAKEFGILELLSLRKGIALGKGKLLAHLYGGRDEPDHKIIDVFVCKMRRKLAAASDGESYIETVRGAGYLLRDRADQTVKGRTANSARAIARTAT
jgi:two-component system cell cycle response regulator CtrA